MNIFVSFDSHHILEFQKNNMGINKWLFLFLYELFLFGLYPLTCVFFEIAMLLMHAYDLTCQIGTFANN